MMSTPEIVAQQEENTQHIKDVRDAFQVFKDKEYKRFKDNLTLLIAGGGILWALASFVFNTKSGTENNHNDIIAQNAAFHKEMEGQQKHYDAKMKELCDSIKYSLVPLTNSINELKTNQTTQATTLRSLNEKCDRLEFFTERWVNGKLQVNSVK